MYLAKTTNIRTGSQSDEFHICYDCYCDMDHNLAFNAPEICLCIVAEEEQGTCSECGDRDEGIFD